MQSQSNAQSGQAKPCANHSSQHLPSESLGTHQKDPLTNLLEVLASVISSQATTLSNNEEEAIIGAIEAQTRALREMLQHKVRVYGAQGLRSLSETAKILKVKPHELFEFLENEHWVYYPRKWCGRYASPEMVKEGYLERKVVQVTGIEGNGDEIEQVLVTPKGLAKLAEDLNLWKSATISAGEKVQP